jgi:hypothetical protein
MEKIVGSINFEPFAKVFFSDIEGGNVALQREPPALIINKK